VVIVEGYLALHTEIAGAYDLSVYFDLDAETRYERRRQARGSDDTESVKDSYHTRILQPMHDRYVEPTKSTADVVVEIASRSPKTSPILYLIYCKGYRR
jgi:uridine kinase